MPNGCAPVWRRERRAMSEDALMTLLDEFKTLSPSDRRAVERQLSISERRLLRRTLARSAAPLEEPPDSLRIDVSPYSGPLAKHLLRILAPGDGAAPRPITAATRETLLVHLKRGRT